MIDEGCRKGPNHQTRLTSLYITYRTFTFFRLRRRHHQRSIKITFTIRKRTVSEVQLMHNLGERKQVQERREWLQTRLQGIHTTEGQGRSGEVDQTRR
ncbi:parathyroid hormone 1a [Xiphias gladius]|uniref:parathyroid hormone 1a n=1 Tax=Xiphias gladius TaxID=8245 RepID=UPI001A97D9B1|nr:parathyroid hormone 1a [Xiphias gladius]